MWKMMPITVQTMASLLDELHEQWFDRIGLVVKLKYPVSEG